MSIFDIIIEDCRNYDRLFGNFFRFGTVKTSSHIRIGKEMIGLFESRLVLSQTSIDFIMHEPAPLKKSNIFSVSRTIYSPIIYQRIVINECPKVGLTLLAPEI